MSDAPTVIFALDHSVAQTQALAKAVSIHAGIYEERRFTDGEFKLRPITAARGIHALVLASLHRHDGALSPHDRLCRMLMLTMALLDHGAERVSLVIPCLAYARKDRRTQPQDPASFRYLAQWVESSGVHALATLEPHNLAAFDCAFRIRAIALPAHQVLLDTVAPMMQIHADVNADTARRAQTPVPWTIVSPDPGGIKRAQAWCEAITARGLPPPPLALFNKRRAAGVLSLSEEVWGTVQGHHALIVDDLLATGQTLVNAAVSLKEAGAHRVLAAVGHGFFDGDALDRILDSPIERVLVTDSTGWQAPNARAAERIICVNAQLPLLKSLA